MADQRKVQPLGIVKGHILKIAGLKYEISFIVLKLEESNYQYPMILGRPWLRAAKVKQDWGSNKLII